MNTSIENKWNKKRMFFLPVLIIGLFAISGVVMYLWNTILTNVVEVHSITYWQAMGLFVLSRILFGRFNFNKHKNGHQRFTSPAMKDKLLGMTEEEKLEMKEQWKRRCGK